MLPHSDFCLLNDGRACTAGKRLRLVVLLSADTWRNPAVLSVRAVGTPATFAFLSDLLGGAEPPLDPLLAMFAPQPVATTEVPTLEEVLSFAVQRLSCSCLQRSASPVLANKRAVGWRSLYRRKRPPRHKPRAERSADAELRLGSATS